MIVYRIEQLPGYESEFLFFGKRHIKAKEGEEFNDEQGFSASLRGISLAKIINFMYYKSFYEDGGFPWVRVLIIDAEKYYVPKHKKNEFYDTDEIIVQKGRVIRVIENEKEIKELLQKLGTWNELWDSVKCLF